MGVVDRWSGVTWYAERMQFFKLCALGLPIVVILDFLWISFTGDVLYRAQIGSILAPQVFWPAAIAFYLMFVSALVLFCVQPALLMRSFSAALLLGACLGFVAYATYDLTNLATIRDWPLMLSIIDMAWGSVLSAIVAGGTYLLATKFLDL